MNKPTVHQPARKPPVPTVNRAPSATARAPFGTSHQQNSSLTRIPAADSKTSQMRSQLNQTNGQFVNRLGPGGGFPNGHKPMQMSFAGKPGSAQRIMPSTSVIHHPLETEISVIYSLFKKTQELMAAAQSHQQQAKLATSFDVDKWKKKFYLVFTRERGILDLSLNPALPVDLKNLTLDPTSQTKVGLRILKSNVKFWVIYLQLVQERLNDFAKSHLRARLLGNPGGEAGLFSNNKEDFDTLVRECGSIIDADKALYQPVSDEA